MPDVGPPKKTKNSDHINHEEIASGCCGHRDGLQLVGIRFARHSTLGPRRRCDRFFRAARPNRGHAPSARATCSIERVGMSIPMMPARRSGLLRTAARRGDRPGPVNGRVVQAPGALTRSRVAVVRIIGLVSHRRASSPTGRCRRWRSRAATRVVQHAVPRSQGRRAGSIHERGRAPRSR